MHISSAPVFSRSLPAAGRPSTRFQKPGRNNSQVTSGGADITQAPKEDDGMSKKRSPTTKESTKARPVDARTKYHRVLSNLHKEFDGLHLDYAAREHVIKDLKDLDCFSDDGNPGTEDAADSPIIKGDIYMSPFNKRPLALERRLQMRSMENYISRSEDIRERPPTVIELEAHKNRIELRERNINRAVDIFVRRKQAKNEAHNQQMIAFLKEAASAGNQQVRRFAIGFVSRIVNRAKTDYIIREQRRAERSRNEKQRKINAKQVIHRNWRRSRFQRFIYLVLDMISSCKDEEFRNAVFDDAAFKQRVRQKHLSELQEINEYNQRDIRTRKILFSSALKQAAVYGDNNGGLLLQTNAQVKLERKRPDLEPFSSMVNNKGMPMLAPQPVLYEDDVNQRNVETMTYPPIRRFHDVCYRRENNNARHGAGDNAGDDNIGWYTSSLITKEMKDELREKAKRQSDVYSALMKVYTNQTNALAKNSHGESFR